MNLDGPYDQLPESELVKAQAMVGFLTKLAIGAVVPDRGIHTFLIQHAYVNVESFINANQLTWLDRELVTQYIAGGFRDPRKQPDPEPTPDSSRGSVGGTDTRADKDAASSQNLGAGVEKSARGRGTGVGGSRRKESKKGT